MLRLAGVVAVGLLFITTLVVQAAPQSAQSIPQAPSLAAAPPVPNGAWTVYHHDNARTGFDSTQPAAATATTGWVSGTMDAQVYASPLVYAGIVYSATLNNTVYAFNQADGLQIWSTHLTAPTTTGWSCGNVAPMGILGTPVIDVGGGRIYVAGLGSDHLYRVYGLNLTTGLVELTTIIPTNIGTGFDWRIEQQRGALTVANGYVYVPFGGRAGDCGAYHGWVVGVPTSVNASLAVYETPSTASGIWAGGGVLVDDSTGNVFFATGNAIPCSGAINSDSVIRTNGSLALASVQFFQPSDWSAHWCQPDQDLGSVSPVLISPNLMFMSGKYGQGFLLNPTNLGGTNGQLFPARTPYVGVDVCVGNNGNATFGSFAYAAPRVYLSCDGNGLVSLTVNTSTPSFSSCDASCTATGSWHIGGSTTFGPPIVAGGAIWAAVNGGGLYGFNAATGAQIFHSANFGINRFSTPSEAGGQIFVASGTVVRSFNMVKACGGAGLTATPPASAATGAAVLLTGSVSPSCPNPRYRFWIQPPGGAWTIVQDFSPTSTYNWTSTSPAGLYHLEVDVRDQTSTATYDSVFNITYTLNGCTGAGISAAPPPPQQPGPTVVVTGSATCPGTATFRFWTKAPGAAWVIAQDYSTSNTYNWPTAALALGSYGLEVDVRNQGSTTTYETTAMTTYALAVGVCSTPTLTASPPSPGATGAGVTFTSTTTNCPNPLFRFWVQGPGGPWVIKQDYSAANTFNWTGTGLAGSYGIEVDVRDQAEGNSVSYDAVMNITYQLNGCSAVALGANPASPQYPNGSVLLTATATCPGTPTYKFWIKAPGGAWTVVQPYSTTNTFSWPITGLALGSYGLEVDVRDQGGTDSYEKVNNITYILSATPCATAGLTASPPSPGATGGTITFTANTSGCTNPVYRFWIKAPGANWGIVQQYTTNNTFLWQQPATGMAGSYGFEVDVRDQAETTSYDVVKNITYQLNGCSAAGLSASPPNTALHGTTVTLTATATCPGPQPVYRFWIKAPGGSWTIVQDYSTNNAFTWVSPATPGTYYLEVDVRNLGATDTYEKVDNITYVLT